MRTRRVPGTADQREGGRRQVLETIRAAGRIARIDIAKEAGSSPATVTAITSELLAAGLIEECADPPLQDAKRGRPRVALKIRGDAHRVAGVKVSHHAISVVVTDFEGTELVAREMRLPENRMTPQKFCDEILRAIGDACAEAGLRVADLSGIGIGIAGLVDARRNFVYWSSSLRERNVDLGAMLGARVHCPVFLDNDANLVAKAEHIFGEGRNVDDFIVITIEHGVGMGIVLGGKVYRGVRGCGAEFGHTKVHLEGALCQCGQRGCLEAYVGDYALLREANLNSETDHKDLDSLFAAAARGEGIARSILDRAGRMFAMGLANVVNIFDPSLIILSGAQLNYDFLYSDKVIDEMKRWIVQVDAPPPEVKVHGWGDLMWAKGATAYAIEEVSNLTVRELAANAS
ncbi:ROK family protein [Pseudooceanicola sp.]|uniref:ROK family protein n=1 Tax=Pseudooceanicola sp. TaxID=1914328 RepID=UPI00405911B2